MLRRIQDLFNAHMMKQSFLDNNEIYLYLLIRAATFFCLLIHCYLLVIHAVYGLTAIVVINAVSIFLFLCLIPLIHKRYYTPVGLILSMEVILYVTLFTYLCGISTYVVAYYILVIIMQVTIPYGKTRLRLTIMGLIIVCTTICLMVDMLRPAPMIPLPEAAHSVLLASNIYILLLGTVVEVYASNIANNLIRKLDNHTILDLSDQANTDALTRLYNRRYADMYLARLNREVASNNYCVAMVDIDNFKVVNDTYGHAVGDEVLRFLADFLQNNLRKSELVFRWGGEEFLIVLQGVDLPTAGRILDKLRERLSMTDIPTVKGNLRITVTIGVSVMDPACPLTCIEASDQGLYKGKRGGKNMVIAV
jgi:diguanylate cyclase (GGDEF)-like protein